MNLPQRRKLRTAVWWTQTPLLLYCRGIGSMFKSFARQVQGAMPVVGLISRLAAPSGGIGSDELVSS